MTDADRGDLFIVDNSVSGWTGLRYLEEWTEIATSFDIATGFFEIGALLALDEKWQQLDKIRILMGAEMTRHTRKELLDAVQKQALVVLDKSLEVVKAGPNPFLHGVPAIQKALSSGQIECRIYDREKFHAKTYITHAKLEVVGAKALVGSSNFTEPGLTRNVELNVQVQSPSEVAQLQEWFETHWNEAHEVTDVVIESITRHTRAYTPFDVYAKALHEFFRGHELSATEWDENRSQMFPQLDRYQQEAYWALMKIARRHGGAFLCDGVGLGKTFVGLMLIERLILHENKRVVLFAPKATTEAVWLPHIRKYLPHIGNTDFSNLAVFNHTDLGREGDYVERFERIAEQADVVVIDEAHHFRNPGRLGGSEGHRPSRYRLLDQLLAAGETSKSVFFLTATPINNRLHDFRYMVELFTRRNEAYFARTVGVNNLTSYFTTLEKALRQQTGGDAINLAEYAGEAHTMLSGDELFRALVVQRSRAYARESQIRATGHGAVFPRRQAPIVADYSIRKSYGRLLDMVEMAFEKDEPLFTLPIYYPLASYIGSDKTIDSLEENRQKQVVALIRTLFLKRFESSVTAFEQSCDRLMRKLLAFLEVHCETDPEKERLDGWKQQNANILKYLKTRQLELWSDREELEEDDDMLPPELLEDVEKLDRAEYNVGEMIETIFLDLEQLLGFLTETRQFEPSNDDKLQKLIRLLRQGAHRDHKFLIFTEFADTARYLSHHLSAAGFDGVEQVDSARSTNRADVITRFSPYYNGSTSAEPAQEHRSEIRILISTDVLSEGLNLQDASRMINYDIHWNPVRLMQRIGRVDRRLNPEVEQALIQDHPALEDSRGKVWFWNFLPPKELDAILRLYTRVTQKTMLISKTLGIEGKKFLTPDDDYAALREFNQGYEGTRTTVENMHLEYQDLLRDHPSLRERLETFPHGVFSGRKKLARGLRGVFFCYSLPALDNEKHEFTEEAGRTDWYFYDLEIDPESAILEDPGEIAESIRSKPATPRRCRMEEVTLLEARKRVERHITNTYLKKVDAPVDVRPVLKCWMELDEG